MNKKAASPLTTTIVLLVVSIIIGIVVMTWGRSFVEQTTSSVNVIEEPQQDTVLQDLNDRLDRGEISKEQYDKIKEILLKQNS